MAAATQEIVGIATFGEGGSVYEVGSPPGYSRRRKVTAIVPIRHNGAVNCYEVHVDGALWRSVNARYVEHVEFALPPLPEDSGADDDRLPF